jgi:hypothetical protein
MKILLGDFNAKEQTIFSDRRFGRIGYMKLVMIMELEQ